MDKKIGTHRNSFRKFEKKLQKSSQAFSYYQNRQNFLPESMIELFDQFQQKTKDNHRGSDKKNQSKFHRQLTTRSITSNP